MRRSSCSNNVATTVCSRFIVYDPDFNAQECLNRSSRLSIALLVAICSSACVNALFFLLQRGMFVKGLPNFLQHFVQANSSKASDSFRVWLFWRCDGKQSPVLLSRESALFSLVPRAARDLRRVPLSAEVQRNDFFFQAREWNDGPPFPHLNKQSSLTANEKKEEITARSFAD